MHCPQKVTILFCQSISPQRGSGNLCSFVFLFTKCDDKGKFCEISESFKSHSETKHISFKPVGDLDIAVFFNLRKEGEKSPTAFLSLKKIKAATKVSNKHLILLDEIALYGWRHGKAYLSKRETLEMTSRS